MVDDAGGAGRVTHHCDAPGISSEHGYVLMYPDECQVLIQQSKIPSGFKVFQAKKT